MKWIRLLSLLMRGRLRIVVSDASAAGGSNRRCGSEPPEGRDLQTGRSTVAPAQVKTYYADSPSAALCQAAQELGQEALLFSAKKVVQGTQELGAYEVVCGTAEPPAFHLLLGDSMKEENPKVAEPAASHGTGSFAKLIEGLFSPHQTPAQKNEEKRQEEPQEHQSEQVERERRDPALLRPRAFATSRRPAGLPENPGRPLQATRVPQHRRAPREAVQLQRAEALHRLQADIRARLIRQGLPDRLASSVTERASAALDAAAQARDGRVERALWEAVRREMLCRIRTDDRLGSEDGKPHVAMLVGPPRCGKTITALKLASRALHTGADAVRLLLLQPSQLGTGPAFRFAERFGLPWQPVSDLNALERALAQVSSGLVLVDTPGFPAGNLTEIEPLSRFLEARRNIDVHFTLPLTLRDEELARQVELYELLRPNKLLFTMLDRTEAWGTVFREACRTGKAISFLGNGRSIPQNLLPARAEHVVDLILAACTCPIGQENYAQVDGSLIESR